MEMQRSSLPFGGLNATPPSGLARIFVSPGPIYDPEGRRPDFCMRFAELPGAALKRGAKFVHDAHQSIPDGPLHVANWLIRNLPAYYEAQRRGAVAFIGLLVDSPTDGSDFYVPYDGFLKDLPAVWVGREHAARVETMADAGQAARLLSVGENRVVDSHNIVGVIRGSGDGVNGGNENIIITCHHDAPFASAVEDASGMAVLLALAKAFAAARDNGHPLHRDLIFVARRATSTAALAIVFL